MYFHTQAQLIHVALKEEKNKPGKKLMFCLRPKRNCNILQPNPGLQGCFLLLGIMSQLLSWLTWRCWVRGREKKPVHTPSRPAVAESECSELQSHTSCSMFLTHFRQEASGLNEILAIASDHPTLHDFSRAAQVLSADSWTVICTFGSWLDGPSVNHIRTEVNKSVYCILFLLHMWWHAHQSKLSSHRPWVASSATNKDWNQTVTESRRLFYQGAPSLASSYERSSVSFRKTIATFLVFHKN